MQAEYYLGLDIGTNSVGYAVTDAEYNLLKFKGEPMWGSHVFEEGKLCAERRTHRTARRRLHRRQQRVLLTQEIFAKEIAKVDERFFVRLQESALHRDDVKASDQNVFFNDDNYRDKDYYAQYPTIHHLLAELMKSDEPHDARLVYLAVAWLMAHRGHFLSEVDKDNIEGVLDFQEIYKDFCDWMEQNECKKWDCGQDEFQKILLMKTGVTGKEAAFKQLLYRGKYPKANEDSVIDEGMMVKLLSGGTVKSGKLFPSIEYETSVDLCFRDAEDKFEEAIGILGEESEWVLRLRKLYDWAILRGTLKDARSVSEAKVAVYEQHHKDLIRLKAFIRKYLPKSYGKIFRYMESKEDKNYVAYSYQLKSVKGILPKGKATQEDFCDYLKKVLKDVSCQPEDQEFYDSMMERLEQKIFLPKQVAGENRVIPYQLYYYELKKILEHAAGYLPFLQEKDSEGYTNTEKLLSVFTFRIPYFIGPLQEKSTFAWIERKKSGYIYPWNFKEMVDFDKSEEAFIRRMTNTCTYLMGKPVLPQGSLIYEKYMVLNEINNLKVNGTPISVEMKQIIYHEIFENPKKGKRVTQKAIRDLLTCHNCMGKGDVLSGVDINIHSGLKSYLAFSRLLEQKVLTQAQVERIIERLTYSEDKQRIKAWLAREFSQLEEPDLKYISKLKYQDFGRLSKEFLCEFEGVSKATGEKQTIIEFLWSTNDNLMQILSDRYTFQESLESEREAYYRGRQDSIAEVMEDMRVSNSVKRAIYRTVDIVTDVCKACKKPPKKIFIEMARGGGEKGKRTVSRRTQIQDLYKSLGKEFAQEVRELSAQLDGISDNRLQSEVLYLYFIQLGKSMYSGVPLHIESLKDDKLYNVDHIYPRSIVKDDSLDNKVLVTSQENGVKGDRFPIDGEIRRTMASLWESYYKHGLISEKKYQRLMRSTSFTTEEKWGFINRQLVETRQSTKALAVIFQEKYPETEIVYTKAGLVSDFRHEFDLVKSRLINDLHHAKDAYLNIVTGNVYHSKFNRKWFSPEQTYSIKTTTIFQHPVYAGKQIAWKGKDDIGRIKKTMEKNSVHYTRFAFIRKGALFDQMPVKAQEGLVPLKQGLAPSRYGGYNKPTASFYLLARYVLTGKKPQTDIMFVPVELLAAPQVQKSEEEAVKYAQYSIAQILGKETASITEVSLPLGQRPIKINTMFSFDGFNACLSGKSDKGRRVLLTSMVSLCLDREKEVYIKKLESFQNKKEKNRNLKADEKYDSITVEKNIALYDFFCQKLSIALFKKAVFSNQCKVLMDGRDKFIHISVEEQIATLLNILSILKTGRSGGCDLSSIGGSKNAAAYVMSASLQNLSKNYHDIHIIETSASGLYASKSKNLLEYL